MPAHHIPLWLKIVYTLFVAILVPVYWRTYSPWNFLYFCDTALLLTVPAIWLESQFLVSIETLAILIPQAVWVIDFIVTACGVRLLGMTGYMFDPNLPLGTRLLSLFHGWLPILLLYLLYRLGYDRRAIYWQSGIGIAVILICYFVAPHTAPLDRPESAINVNYVLGPDTHHRQTWISPAAFLALLCAGLPLVVYLPTHLLLRWLIPTRGGGV
ncbi:MAG TPA: hypothetical protein VHY37_04855 [Tepidisphaeraceae bacterium]|jgi:hypothetical protein|nr:hypothetical protein [Tepidisphaeraceae bacterium]